MDLVEEVVPLADRELAVLRPRNSEALLDEHAFEEDEFMPYWAELWPSGVALAKAIAGRALKGAAVLELGCGLGLPSLAAARAGGRVLAVDWSAAAIELLEANAERNGVAVEGLVATWTDPAPLLARAPFRLVLAADVAVRAAQRARARRPPAAAGWRGAARGPGAAAPARVPRRGRDRMGAPAGVPPALTPAAQGRASAATSQPAAAAPAR